MVVLFELIDEVSEDGVQLSSAQGFFDCAESFAKKDSAHWNLFTIQSI